MHALHVIDSDIQPMLILKGIFKDVIKLVLADIPARPQIPL